MKTKKEKDDNDKIRVCPECGDIDMNIGKMGKMALLVNKIEEFQTFANFIDIDPWDERRAILIALFDSSRGARDAGIPLEELEDFDKRQLDFLEESWIISTKSKEKDEKK